MPLGRRNIVRKDKVVLILLSKANTSCRLQKVFVTLEKTLFDDIEFSSSTNPRKKVKFHTHQSIPHRIYTEYLVYAVPLYWLVVGYIGSVNTPFIKLLPIIPSNI